MKSKTKKEVTVHFTDEEDPVTCYSYADCPSDWICCGEGHETSLCCSPYHYCCYDSDEGSYYCSLEPCDYYPSPY